MANPEFSHDVESALKFIKKKFSAPTVVVGYSMGGVLLLNYLALGYDQADLYIPTCCTLNMKNFNGTIASHALFNTLQKYSYSQCGVDSHESLLKAAGTTPEEYDKFTEHFLENLNKTQSNWISKLIYVISSNDPLTQDYDEYIHKLDICPYTYVVSSGWHCCLESLQLTVQLACNYLIARDKGLSPSLEEIKC